MCLILSAANHAGAEVRAQRFGRGHASQVLLWPSGAFVGFWHRVRRDDLRGPRDCHVRAVTSGLADLANFWGWQAAGDLQLVLLCVVGAVAALLLRPERMAARRL